MTFSSFICPLKCVNVKQNYKKEHCLVLNYLAEYLRILDPAMITFPKCKVFLIISVLFLCFKYRSTTQEKFELTYDLQIMESIFHVPEMFALTTERLRALCDQQLVFVMYENEEKLDLNIVLF